MTDPSATFEAALLSDCVSKAAKVAPNKGAAFDRAAGIMFEVHPDIAYVKATDLESTYRQRVAVVKSEGITTPQFWRMSSTLLANFLASLPLSSGSQVTFRAPDDKTIRIKAGPTDVKLNLFVADFPSVPEFDAEGMAEANDLAARIASVAWATDRKAQNIFSGVHIDGDFLVATDKYKLALYPCKTPVTAPVTVAASTVATLLKSASEVRIRAVDTEFQMMLDPETQMTTRIYEGKYPNYQNLRRDDYTGQVQVSRSHMLDVVQRMMTVISGEKTPRLDITADADEDSLLLEIHTPNGEYIRDVVPYTGDIGAPTVVRVHPEHVINTLQGSKLERISFSFGHPDPARAEKVAMRFRDENGYEVHITPTREVASK